MDPESVANAYAFGHTLGKTDKTLGTHSLQAALRAIQDGYAIGQEPPPIPPASI